MKKLTNTLFTLVGVCIGLLVIFGSFLYLLPTGVAIIRNRTNTVPIFILNLFLGWTLVGWVIALMWATAQDNKK